MINRAQRRLQNRFQRRSGRFVGELERRADQRAYQEALREQMTREANGEPVPPEIAARMTKEKEPDALFQVGVTVRQSGKVWFLGPMMGADACGNIAEAVNRQIMKGQRSDWSKAEVYPMTVISQGA